ncbi:MAG: DUF4959 domain-containing protein [Sphingobacterium sp.]|jgi:hypothetical protein|nr:DUF4959 domain-containing protein [Sphingobacterium sp.]
MKMTIKSYTFSANLILLLSLFVLSCTKIDTQQPIHAKKGRPGLVTDVSVKNSNGSATITYSLPKGNGAVDPLYVMAEYEINKVTHRKRQAKASIYDNQILVDGFNTAGEYTVTLYSVSAAEEKSDPVQVKVNPGTPPFREILSSVNMMTDFGGIAATFDNPTKSKVAVSIITLDKNNEYYPAQTLYTASEEGNIVARGFENKLRKFGLFIRDGFDNYSDTLWLETIPFFEKQLDKTKFREYNTPGDNAVGYNWVVSNLWDNNLGTGYHTQEGITMPARVTFDLGELVKLSRFKIYQRDGDEYLFNHANPRLWTMWGSVNPAADGSYSGWTKLMDCESVKPSKSPLGILTAEDKAVAKAGEEFVFPLSIPEVRYIRVECQQNWSNSSMLHIMEFTFWGDR